MKFLPARVGFSCRYGIALTGFIIYSWIKPQFWTSLQDPADAEHMIHKLQSVTTDAEGHARIDMDFFEHILPADYFFKVMKHCMSPRVEKLKNCVGAPSFNFMLSSINQGHHR